MTNAELNYAKNLGKQVAKGKILYCPLCKGKLTLDYNKQDQDLSSWGDHENTLFCPHCDTNIDLVVTFDTAYNSGGTFQKWVEHLLGNKND